MPPPHAHLGYDLRLACMRLSRRVRANTPSLPPHFFSVLARLEHGSTMAADLAHVERVSAASMSRTVAELVDRGLVERTPSESDKRCVVLSLSEKGRELLTEARKERDVWMTRQLLTCTPTEIETLQAATTIIERLCQGSE